ncbi:hypothetical protein HOY34_17270 [Xinfangfangia sp. D13-10-4-6]|uniref:hypothetical protein n=1 Tax=Pseudogemmobacter hezensis TaxID=2737662 RepID=UPI001553DB59|nr:hypothetical protein [Pseudogemmobacter hezensis]NPD16946.1 hypothetical protein [Pseudogemmobacter hezensis]
MKSELITLKGLMITGMLLTATAALAACKDESAPAPGGATEGTETPVTPPATPTE